MQFSLGNMHETGDAASQVKQGVHLHSGLGAAEVRPRKHRQAQIAQATNCRVRIQHAKITIELRHNLGTLGH